MLIHVGFILGINRGAWILSNSLAGLIYDRGNHRRFYIPSIFLGAFSTLLYAVTSSFWSLALARVPGVLPGPESGWAEIASFWM